MKSDDPQTFDDRPSSERSIVLWVPKKNGGRDPINWNRPTDGLIQNFERTLESAIDERPLQEFFEQMPQALLTGVVSPHRGWVIPKPTIPEAGGRFWQPDFIVCDWSSVGPEWFIVELESPTGSPLLKKGDTSSICNHAINQIHDYRNAIDEHGYFLRGNGWPKLHGKFQGIIIIGRRGDPLRAQYPDRLRQYRSDGIEIMSYDRVLERCREFQEMVDNWAAQLAALMSKQADSK